MTGKRPPWRTAAAQNPVASLQAAHPRLGESGIAAGTGPRSAFTLVEIMVAIAILALVVAAIYSTWTAILRASKVGLEAAAAAQRERVALRVMQDALASARLFSANWQWYYFAAQNGDDASLSFVSHLPKWFPRAGKFGDHDVRRVTFSLEDGPGSQRQLVLRQAPLLMDVDQDEQDHPLVLERNVKKLEFEFWDERLGEWTDDWMNTNTVPRMVRITLAFDPSDPSRHGWAAPETEEITRVVSVAATGVQQSWQMPGMPGHAPGHAAGPRGGAHAGRPARAGRCARRSGKILMKIPLHSAPRGIALIIVLISIVVLSVLATGFAYSMKVETRLARNANYDTELEWMGRSGVESRAGSWASSC